jgi:hypothetical protein
VSRAWREPNEDVAILTALSLVESVLDKKDARSID